MYQLAIVLGIAVSQLVNYALQAAAGGDRNQIAGLEAWQWMLMLEAVPAVLYLIMTTTIPESPRFLVAQARTIVLARSSPISKVEITTPSPNA